MVTLGPLVLPFSEKALFAINLLRRKLAGKGAKVCECVRVRVRVQVRVLLCVRVCAGLVCVRMCAQVGVCDVCIDRVLHHQLTLPTQSSIPFP
jgi:hypothetical protein